MSDPFERLRMDDAATTRPDIEAIRRRARRIDRRHRMVWGVFTSTTLTVLVVVAVVLAVTSRPRLRSDNPPLPGPALNSMNRPASPSTSPEVPEQQVDPSQPKAAVPASTFSVRLQLSAKVILPGEQVVMRVSACNESPEVHERTFTSGQRYDFEVLREGSVVWRWGAARGFETSGALERWLPRECRSFEESWRGTDEQGAPVAAGSYEVVGRITSSPGAGSSPEAVCVGACT